MAAATKQYEITVRELEPVSVLLVHNVIPLSSTGIALGEAFRAVWECAERHGVQPNGMPFARYYSVVPERVVFDAGVPVPQALRGEGAVQAGELPGGEAAVTTHIGAYDQMEPAYEAVRAWMRANGREEAGAPWEVYFSDPQQEPDAQKWRTEIVWPLK